MRTSIDVITTQERRVQNSRQSGMQSSTYSASNTSYHQCYFYCACYVLGNSVTIFFPKQINCTTHSRECLLFQNFGNCAGTQANEKQKNISTNNQRLLDEVKYDLENFADRSVCYALHRDECSHSHESQLKPLVFITFFFFQYVLNLKTSLPRSM